MIALKAELTQVKDSNLKLSKQLKAKLKTPSNSSNTPQANASSSSSGQKTRNQKNTSNCRRQKQDKAWKKVAPKSGESKTKTKDNKTWHWCIHHLAWCLHSSDECRKGKDTQKPTVSRQSSGSNDEIDRQTGLNRQLLAHLAAFAIQDE